MSAYTAEDCEILAKALDYAWEIFLKSGRLTKENLDTARAALTYSILQAAQGGERNPRRLALEAAANVDAIEPRIRMERSVALPARARVAA
jgi:hypothetical protein